MARQLQLNPYGPNQERRPEGTRGKPPRYPLAMAAVGDWFVVETADEARSVRQCARRLRGLHGKRFSLLRTTDPAGERYWVCTRVE